MGALRERLDVRPEESLYLDEAFLARWGTALNVVAAEDPEAISMTFTSAYGRSPVYCGSYLRDQGGLRRFSPREILRLLDFPADYALPETLPPQRGYRLVGNSLSVRVVGHLLEALG